MSHPADPTTPEPGNGLLGRLPANIRKRIYILAGAITDETIPLDRYCPLRNHLPFRASDLVGPPVDWAPTLALLKTCRLVYTEMASLIYSSNRFSTHDLRPLRKLTLASSRSLTALKIQVHSARFPSSLKSDHCNVLYMGYSSQDLDSSVDRKTIDNWVWTATQFGTGVQAGKLDLWFICDVDDVETANLVLAPLRQWPVLRRCSIRLSNRKNQALRNLAYVTSRALMGLSDTPPPTFFPYSRLPTELRFKILQYTDLVTPWTLVQWLMCEGFSFKNGLCCRVRDLKYDPRHPRGFRPDAPQPDEPGEFVCGSDGASSTSDGSVDSAGPSGSSEYTIRQQVFRQNGNSHDWMHYECHFKKCQRYTSLYQGTGCFCSRYHAAYTPTCTCWQSPVSLFLVSKAFSREAMAVFLSSNHFQIFEAPGISFTKENPKAHERRARYKDICPIVGFLEERRKAGLLHDIKSLSLNFSRTEFEISNIQSSRPSRPLKSQAEWRRAAELVSSDTNLRFLDISASRMKDFPELEGWRDFDQDAMFNMARRIIDTCIWPLTEAGPPRGVGQLRVHLHGMTYYKNNLSRELCMWYNIRTTYHRAPREAENCDVPDYKVFSRGFEASKDGHVLKWVEQVWIAEELDRFETHSGLLRDF
ncbi:hypothetical protein F4808DRAFT_446532 [Astrocystis sublimbata]|nr:hypothetical protein F4808DRAFT_446965 [Astrocystis sublimbata]KAI0187935.1 hypothetical protein F4808DRAFT_446532 [Astrocystis sublimbata]